MIKSVVQTLIVSIILNCETLETLSSESWTRKCIYYHYFYLPGAKDLSLWSRARKKNPKRLDRRDSLIAVGKESAHHAGDPGSIPGSGRSPGEGNGKPLQYSCLENPQDRGAWQATVHGVARVGHNLATNLPPRGHYHDVYIEKNLKGSAGILIVIII